MTDAAPETAAPPPQRRRLGEVLVAEGVLTDAQLQRALDERLRGEGHPERLGRAIVRLQLATDADIARALAKQLGLRWVRGDHLPVNKDATGLLPAPLARRYGLIPLKRTPDDTLIVACADPTDVVALDDTRLAAGVRRVVPVVATFPAVDLALQTAYGLNHQAGELVGTMPLDVVPQPELLAGASASDKPVVRLVERILSEAINSGASDIHIEPGARDLAVRFRIDGVLHTLTSLPLSASAAVLSRLKVLSGLDIAERRRPQDGRMRFRPTDASASGIPTRPEVDLRVSTLPSIHGETMVLRILRTDAQRLQLADAGLSDPQQAVLAEALAAPQGLILVTGPTGSGKTTTLYGMLGGLTDFTRKVVTLEDPIEYRLAGASQTQMNEAIGLTFARSLRTVLRQDPDVVMVGEVRDPETAELALQASLTGHLVLSTLHTNDAPSAIVRLRDLGVASYLIASSLSLVVAQRLARRLCPHCAEPCQPSPLQADQLHLSPEDARGRGFLVGTGCVACRFTGYRGRVGLFEILPVDGRVREAVSQSASTAVLRRAGRANGLRTLRQDGLRQARAGATSLAEVLRVTPDVADDGVCPVCAQAVEGDYRLCPWCGCQLQPSCATCERPLTFGWRVCPTCGTEVPGRADPSPTPESARVRARA